VSNVKINNEAQKICSTNKEKKLSGFVATSQKLQKVIRRGLKSNEELRKITAKYSSMMPDKAKHAAKTIGIPFLLQLNNLLEYINLMDYDLICLFEEMAITRSRWKKKLYARLVVNNLYECANDFAFLLGNPLKEQLIVIHLPNLEVARRTIHKEIVKFHKSHNAFLKRIRNSVIAHRDHNAESQIEAIKSLKTNEIYRLGTEYFAWASKFRMLLATPLMKELVARLTLLSIKTIKKYRRKRGRKRGQICFLKTPNQRFHSDRQGRSSVQA